MKFYLCGPMSGVPEHNFPAFNHAATRLRNAGHIVNNPAENVADGDGAAEEEALRRAHYMRLDIFQIIGRNPRTSKVDAIVVLPGWDRSRGARLEVEIGLQLDIPILWAETLAPLDESDFVVANKFTHEQYLMPNYQGVPA